MAKPPVPPPRPSAGVSAKPPPPARPRVPTLHDDNPFLPASASKISSSKIDAGWAAEEQPESLDSEALIPASVEAPGSVKVPAAKPAAPVPPPAPAPAPVVAKAPEPATPEAKAPSVAPASITPPVQKRSRGKVLAFLMLPVLVLAGGGFAYQKQQEADRLAKLQAVASQSVPPPVEEPVLSVEPPPPPTHMADPPPPSASATEAKKPSGVAPAASYALDQRAYLDATAIPAGQKILVDGRVVGIAPRRVQVHCGTHRVQIGDQDPESIAFPCGGGEVSFSP